MPLVKEILALELKGIFTEMKNNSMDENDYADKLAQAIDNYIKTADVNTVVNGGAVPPTGGAIAGATGKGKLS